MVVRCSPLFCSVPLFSKTRELEELPQLQQWSDQGSPSHHQPQLPKLVSLKASPVCKSAYLLMKQISQRHLSPSMQLSLLKGNKILFKTPSFYIGPAAAMVNEAFRRLVIQSATASIPTNELEINFFLP